MSTESSGDASDASVAHDHRGTGWSDERADEAAGILWSAWQRGELIDPLPVGCRPESFKEGYSVQARLAGRVGTTLGWKIAATSLAGQRHIAVDRPLAGRLFTRYVVEDGGSLSVSKGHMHMRVAEAEFAFRIGSQPASPGARGRDYASGLHLAIELPDSRFANFETSGGPQLVADDACGSHFVLGPAVPGWREVDLIEQSVVVRVNREEAALGSGRNVLSGPLDALDWLARELDRYGERLRPGDIVTTGVAAVPVPVSPGDHVVADFPSLGSVSIHIAA